MQFARPPSPVDDRIVAAAAAAGAGKLGHGGSQRYDTAKQYSNDGVPQSPASSVDGKGSRRPPARMNRSLGERDAPSPIVTRSTGRASPKPSVTASSLRRSASEARYQSRGRSPASERQSGSMPPRSARTPPLRRRVPARASHLQPLAPTSPSAPATQAWASGTRVTAKHGAPSPVRSLEAHTSDALFPAGLKDHRRHQRDIALRHGRRPTLGAPALERDLTDAERERALQLREYEDDMALLRGTDLEARLEKGLVEEGMRRLGPKRVPIAKESPKQDPFSRDISFMQDAAHHRKTLEAAAARLGTRADAANSLDLADLPPSLIPAADEIREAVPMPSPHADAADFDADARAWTAQVFPSRLPTGRNDVRLLQQWLDFRSVPTDASTASATDVSRAVADKEVRLAMGSDVPGEPLPHVSDSKAEETYKASLEDLRSAQFVCSAAFNEIVRQVSTGCVERGALLARIWHSYLGLFDQMAGVNKPLRDGIVTLRKECIRRARALRRAQLLAEALEQEVQQLKDEISRLKDKMEDERKAAKEALDKEHAELVEWRDLARGKGYDPKSHLAQIASLTEQLNDANDETETLMELKVALETQLSDSQLALARAEADIADREDVIQQLRDQLETFKAANPELVKSSKFEKELLYLRKMFVRLENRLVKTGTVKKREPDLETGVTSPMARKKRAKRMKAAAEKARLWAERAAGLTKKQPGKGAVSVAVGADSSAAAKTGTADKMSIVGPPTTPQGRMESDQARSSADALSLTSSPAHSPGVPPGFSVQPAGDVDGQEERKVAGRAAPASPGPVAQLIAQHVATPLSHVSSTASYSDDDSVSAYRPDTRGTDLGDRPTTVGSAFTFGSVAASPTSDDESEAPARPPSAAGGAPPEEADETELKQPERTSTRKLPPRKRRKKLKKLEVDMKEQLGRMRRMSFVLKHAAKTGTGTDGKESRVGADDDSGDLDHEGALDDLREKKVKLQSKIARVMVRKQQLREVEHKEKAGEELTAELAAAVAESDVEDSDVEDLEKIDASHEEGVAVVGKVRAMAFAAADPHVLEGDELDDDDDLDAAARKGAGDDTDSLSADSSDSDDDIGHYDDDHPANSEHVMALLQIMENLKSDLVEKSAAIETMQSKDVADKETQVDFGGKREKKSKEALRLNNSLTIKTPDFWGSFMKGFRASRSERIPRVWPIHRLRAYLLDTWIERLKMDSADTKMDSSNHKAKRQMDMATFMTDFMLTRYGVKRLVQLKLRELLFSVDKHAADLRVNFFARAVGSMNPVPAVWVTRYVDALGCVMRVVVAADIKTTKQTNWVVDPEGRTWIPPLVAEKAIRRVFGMYPSSRNKLYEKLETLPKKGDEPQVASKKRPKRTASGLLAAALAVKMERVVGPQDAYICLDYFLQAVMDEWNELENVVVDQWKEVFAKVDDDKNDVLDLNEFIAAVRLVPQVDEMSESEIRVHFMQSLIDAESPFVDQGQFISILRKLARTTLPDPGLEVASATAATSAARQLAKGFRLKRTDSGITEGSEDDVQLDLGRLAELQDTSKDQKANVTELMESWSDLRPQVIDQSDSPYQNPATRVLLKHKTQFIDEIIARLRSEVLGESDSARGGAGDLPAIKEADEELDDIAAAAKEAAMKLSLDEAWVKFRELVTDVQRAVRNRRAAAVRIMGVYVRGWLARRHWARVRNSAMMLQLYVRRWRRRRAEKLQAQEEGKEGE